MPLEYGGVSFFFVGDPRPSHINTELQFSTFVVPCFEATMVKVNEKGPV